MFGLNCVKWWTPLCVYCCTSDQTYWLLTVGRSVEPFWPLGQDDCFFIIPLILHHDYTVPFSSHTTANCSCAKQLHHVYHFPLMELSVWQLLRSKTERFHIHLADGSLTFASLPLSVVFQQRCFTHQPCADTSICLCVHQCLLFFIHCNTLVCCTSLTVVNMDVHFCSLNANVNDGLGGLCI